MVNLEEYAKINNLLASCNEMINGKFILADYKIANILKNITESQEVYDLIAKCMNGFSFEREFSRAQIKSTQNKKFVLPSEPEKVLPFVFCVLVNINNKNLNFDLFLKEFYAGEHKNIEYVNFAQEVILPFRDIIADYFDIPRESLNNLKTNENENLGDNMEKENLNENYEENLNQEIEETEEEFEEEINFNDDVEEFEEYDEEYENEEPISRENESGLTAEKVEKFLDSVKNICGQIQIEVDYDRRTTALKKEEIVYLCNAIIEDCNDGDLKNVIALLTAFDYVIAKVRTLKFLSRELKKLMVYLYN